MASLILQVEVTPKVHCLEMTEEEQLRWAAIVQKYLSNSLTVVWVNSVKPIRVENGAIE